MIKLISTFLLMGLFLGANRCDIFSRFKRESQNSLPEIRKNAELGPSTSGPSTPSSPVEPPAVPGPEVAPRVEEAPAPKVAPKVGEAPDLVRPQEGFPACPPEKKGPEKLAELAKPFVPKQDPGPSSTDGSMQSLMSAAIIKYTNVKRKEAGRSPVVANSAAMQASQEWSVAQANSGQSTCNHELPNKPLNPRMQKINSSGCSVPSENVAWASGFIIGGRMYNYETKNADVIAKEIVEGWYNSKGHRENMLAPNAKSMGAGIAVSKNGYFSTQIFCTR